MRFVRVQDHTSSGCDEHRTGGSSVLALGEESSSTLPPPRPHR